MLMSCEFRHLQEAAGSSPSKASTEVPAVAPAASPEKAEATDADAAAAAAGAAVAAEVMLAMKSQDIRAMTYTLTLLPGAFGPSTATAPKSRHITPNVVQNPAPARAVRAVRAGV
jgi:hypothetical protein